MVPAAEHAAGGQARGRGGLRRIHGPDRPATELAAVLFQAPSKRKARKNLRGTKQEISGLNKEFSFNYTDS